MKPLHDERFEPAAPTMHCQCSLPPVPAKKGCRRERIAQLLEQRAAIAHEDAHLRT